MFTSAVVFAILAAPHVLEAYFNASEASDREEEYIPDGR